jgi:hypothetical protein
MTARRDVCSKKVTASTVFHLFHLVWRIDGVAHSRAERVTAAYR